MHLKSLPTILLVTTIGAQNPPEYSVDAQSPEVPSPFQPGDLIRTTGTLPAFTAQELGLVPGDEICAISDGFDATNTPMPPSNAHGAYANRYHVYSVDRASVGLSPAITAQSASDGAAADQFLVTLSAVQSLVFWSGQSLLSNSPDHGLTPRPANPDSNIDAMDGTVPLIRDLELQGLFFCLGPGSPSLTSLGINSATVLHQPLPGPSASPPNVFATASQLGLQSGDVIDALAATIPLGSTTWRQTGMTLWYSLDRGSPTLGSRGWSAADLLGQSLVQALSVQIAAATFGLLTTDNLDALTISDPGWGPIPDGCPTQFGDAELTMTHAPYLGSTPSYYLTTPDDPGVLLLMISLATPASPIPLGSFGFPAGCTLHLDPTFGITYALPTQFSGSASLPLPIPVNPSFIGLPLFAQGFVPSTQWAVTRGVWGVVQ